MKYLLLFLLSCLFVGCYQVPFEEPLVAIQIQDRNGLTETIQASDRLEKFSQVDFLTSHPYRKVLRTFKSEGKSKSKITTYHPNGSVWQYLEAEEMRANGTYKEWFPNGRQKIEATVIGGPADLSETAQQDWLFDGVSTVWDEEGNVKALIPYHKGSLEGICTYYASNGSVEQEVSYKQNQIDGFSLSYFPNGWVKEKTGYTRGAKDGLSLGYFEKGEPCWIEEYREGLLLKGVYYNQEGSVISDVEDGRGFQVRYEKDRPTLFVEIQRGSTEGFVRCFSPEGVLTKTYFIKGQMHHGEEILYYPLLTAEEGQKCPQPKISIPWNQDLVHGIVKTWHENGQLESQKEYCKNQLSGPSCAWYTDGALMFVEEYEEGRLIQGLYYRKGKTDPVSTVVGGKGIATLFDSEGIFLRKVFYDKGKPVDPEE